MATSTAAGGDMVAAVRAFNRFYTRQVGALNERLLASRFSLAEVRVLYELAHREALTAAMLGKDLGLDAGYLSRLLASFVQRGLVRRASSQADARQRVLGLTEKGRTTFSRLDRLASAEIDGVLAPLGVSDRRRLLAAMETIRTLLDPRAAADGAQFLLRPPQPGDYGWVVHRHGALYAEEYGWDERFEALVAEVVAAFVQKHDPKRERCWIAERRGEVVGSVFVVKKSETVAQLRLLYVEPSARGLGIGRRLVDECLRFARRTRYRKMTLWTQSTLTAARRIYAAAGFTLVRAEPHESFGYPLTAEIWETKL
jgi:DNA-binding MarR family transcriptional regulator/ribosomal protein S18 acetylase RimI-like enzyme